MRISRGFQVISISLFFVAGAASGQGQFDPNCASNELALRCSNVGPYLISNPNLVLDLQEQLARERQVLEARLQYAQQTGNMALFDQTFDALNSRERVVNENMIAGQVALIALSQQNFAPVAELYERSDVAGTLTVIPYTDGTVGFFRDGQEVSRFSVREIARELYNTYALRSNQ